MSPFGEKTAECNSGFRIGSCSSPAEALSTARNVDGVVVKPVGTINGLDGAISIHFPGRFN